MDSGRLGHTCFSVLVAEGRHSKNKRFLSNKFNPRKWKNENLFPFRFRDRILLMIWICNVYKKVTAVSEGWKTKSVIPQKIVTLIFEYSDEVGEEKRGAKSMIILHYVWHVKSQSHFISISSFHILPSGTFRHTKNVGLVRCPDSEKLFSHKISDHRCVVSRAENLEILI